MEGRVPETGFGVVLMGFVISIFYVSTLERYIQFNTGAWPEGVLEDK